MNKKVLKNIWAVVAGFLTVMILSIGADVVVESLGIIPPASHPELYSPMHLVFALLYRSIFTIAGGYVTAWLSATKPMRNVIILAIIGSIVGTLGTLSNWDKAQATGTWYPIALLALSPFCVWFGGRLMKKN